MASLNTAARELVLKVVYYGPGLGGKTTTLQALHEAAPAERRGKLVSLATPVDRTLYFDFLPLRLPPVRGLAVRLQLFTVPGQVYFNATRRLVLSGADGVVFVADSQGDRLDANLESLENLRDNLAEHGRDLAQLPHAFAWNKRDLDEVVAEAELSRILNRHGAPTFGTVATSGQGVQQTLDAIVERVLAAYQAQLPSAAASTYPATTIDLAPPSVRISLPPLSSEIETSAPSLATQQMAEEVETSAALLRTGDGTVLADVESLELRVAGSTAEAAETEAADAKKPGSGEYRFAPGAAERIEAETLAQSDAPSAPLSPAASPPSSELPSTKQDRPRDAQAKTVRERPPTSPPKMSASEPIESVGRRGTDRPSARPDEERSGAHLIPRAAISFSPLFPADLHEHVRDIEAAIAASRFEEAIAATGQLFPLVLASVASLVGFRSDDPSLALWLGLSPERVLRLRAEVVRARRGGAMDVTSALACYSLVIEAQLAASHVLPAGGAAALPSFRPQAQHAPDFASIELKTTELP